ncbi:MAG: glycohydrolase toxin TNT-related protein [Paludibacteraceae bacterium]|nr:glycohydrolase toxin TNT-related protein [Paludibacteraceae bacterium]
MFQNFSIFVQTLNIRNYGLISESERGCVFHRFEQPGGGIQYVTKVSIEELKKSGYLIEL